MLMSPLVITVRLWEPQECTPISYMAKGQHEAEGGSRTKVKDIDRVSKQPGSARASVSRHYRTEPMESGYKGRPLQDPSTDYRAYLRCLLLTRCIYA